MDYLKSILSSLPAYLGGKRRLVPLIFGTIADVIPTSEWTSLRFLDPMSGGGSVALAGKAFGFNVTAGDAALRGTLVARALIANSKVWLSRHHLLELVIHGSDRGRDSERWQRLFIAARCFPDPVGSLLQLTLTKAYLRTFPMSSPAATDAAAFREGDLDAISPRRLNTYLKGNEYLTPSGLWRIASQVNGGVVGGSGKWAHGDAVDLIASSRADIVYLDPPYSGTTGYTETYRNLDLLLGDAKTPRRHSIEELMEAAGHVPLLILSYGGPDVTADALSSLVNRHRRVVRAVEVPYSHLRSIATTDRRKKTNEIVVIAERR